MERYLALVYAYLTWHKNMLESGPALDFGREHYVNPKHILGISLVEDDEPEDEPGFDIEDEPAEIPSTSLQCDFCGRVVPAKTIEKLHDGRERCQICSRTAVTNKPEIERLFRTTMRRMQEYYGIAFRNPVRVKIVSAWRLHISIGKKFIPTSKFDTRCVGYVILRRGRQELWLENGHPRNLFVSTIAHEFTHVWQHQCDYFIELPANVEESERLEIIEGMASWAEVQFLLFSGELEDAKNLRDSLMRRNDEYGRGYRRYLGRYPHAFAIGALKASPFDNPDDPLGLDTSTDGESRTEEGVGGTAEGEDGRGTGKGKNPIPQIDIEVDRNDAKTQTE